MQISKAEKTTKNILLMFSKHSLKIINVTQHTVYLYVEGEVSVCKKAWMKPKYYNSQVVSYMHGVHFNSLCFKDEPYISTICMKYIYDKII